MTFPDKTPRGWILLLMLLFLNACDTQQAQLHQQQFLLFGTLVDISMWSDDKQKTENAIAQITTDLEKMHNEWHAWHDSPLTRLNKALAAGQPGTVPPSMIPLLQKSIALSNASDGLFSPAIGRLINLWGFQQDDAPNSTPPDAARIQALTTAQPKMQDLTLAQDQLQSRNPNVQLDFGAIAKGYAVDLAIEKLRSLGIHNAIINAGGNLRAIGKHGDRPWRIGIRNPRGSGVLASIEARGDESMLTSGDYERFFEYQGKRYHHIIDPRTGYPARGFTSVTVIYPDAATADAASTALFVAGPQRWRDIAKRMDIQYIMIVDDKGHVTMTPAMAERVRFELKPAPNVNIVALP